MQLSNTYLSIGDRFLLSEGKQRGKKRGKKKKGGRVMRKKAVSCRYLWCERSDEGDGLKHSSSRSCNDCQVMNFCSRCEDTREKCAAEATPCVMVTVQCTPPVVIAMLDGSSLSFAKSLN